MRGDAERGAERGAVLAFVLLLMLALVAIAHGLLALALGELAASRAAVRHLSARAAADGAVAHALRLPGGDWLDTVPVGAPRTLPAPPLGRVAGDVALLRLAPEAWLVEGSAGRPGRAVTRTATLAWLPDPLARVTALDGALSSPPGAPWTLAGVVDVGASSRLEPPLDSADCAPWLAALDARHAIAPLAATGTLADTLGGPGLGLLDFGALLEAAQVDVAGLGTPGPVEALGACVDDAPWGWGDPDRPWRPCGPHLPLRRARGDLTVVGGVGQGVLVVDGNLRLTSGARYYGLVVVRGTLDVEGAASLSGLALTSDGGVVAPGARVVGSPCWAVRALAANRPALGRLLPMPGVGLLGPL